MTHQPLAGKTGVVFGVANKRSIAWAIAKAWAGAGARLFFNYQGERLKENVEELVGEFGEGTPLWPCDVSKDEEITGFFRDRKSTRLNSSHANISYAVFCLKKKKHYVYSKIQLLIYFHSTIITQL